MVARYPHNEVSIQSAAARWTVCEHLLVNVWRLSQCCVIRGKQSGGHAETFVVTYVARPAILCDAERNVWWPLNAALRLTDVCDAVEASAAKMMTAEAAHEYSADLQTSEYWNTDWYKAASRWTPVTTYGRVLHRASQVALTSCAADVAAYAAVRSYHHAVTAR